LEAFSCTRGRPGLVDALRHFILQVWQQVPHRFYGLLGRNPEYGRPPGEYS
jgi:hypothetical protein